MGDKKRAKEIYRTIRKSKKRVAGKLDKKIEKNQHLFSIIVPIFAGLLFFVFAILNLRASVSVEESYAKYATSGGFSDIFNVAISDGRSPIFLVVLKMWAAIFGTSDVALRFMSIFFGFIAIVFLFQLVKKWFGIKAATISTVLVAISPSFVRFGQEISSGMMLLSFMVVLTYVLSLVLEKKIGRKKKNTRRYYLISLAVLFIPWILLMVFRAATGLRGGEVVSLGLVFDFVVSTLFYNGGVGVTGWGVVVGILFIGLFIYAAISVYRNASQKKQGRIRKLGVLILLPIVLLTIFSLPPLQGVFETKKLLYSAVGVLVLLGIVLSMMKDSTAKNALIALLFVVLGLGLFNIEQRETEGHISEILAETFVAAEDGQPILAADLEKFYDVSFYSSEKHPVYIFSDAIEETRGLSGAINHYQTGLVENREDFLKEHESVWYIIDTPAVGVKYEIPEWAAKMRIVSEITLDHHTALEFAF